MTAAGLFVYAVRGVVSFAEVGLLLALVGVPLRWLRHRRFLTSVPPPPYRQASHVHVIKDKP